MKSLKLLLLMTLSALSLFFFQNCAKYDFKPSDAAQLGQGDPIEPQNPIPPVQTTPKLTFNVMDCRAGEWCQVRIRLSSPLAKTFTASWRTADEAAAQRPSYYAVAGTHYVSASGTFTLAAGATETKVEIKSIAWESSQMQTLHIPFSFSNCKVDGASTLCADFL